jgi:predicted RNase H-like nuclease (RuvC/YqgF family)
LNLSVDRLKKEMTTCSEQIRNEQARVRQLQSANACHVRSSEQLEEDLENMRVHVASENAAGERWSVLVSGMWGIKSSVINCDGLLLIFQ